MEDRELVELIKASPEEGLNQAMLLYAPFVKGIAIRILSYREERDVQECLSNVFIRLWRYIDNFDEVKGSLKTYIVTISRNEALRILKKSNKYIEDVSLEEVSLGIEVDMTNEVARDINKDIVEKVIDELGEPDRQIFIKRYFWAERVKQIAIELQLEEKFIENRLYLVKKKLKNKLLERGIIL
ncbi:sigma-70 family RNA polymerase sigma factor [Sporanaerobium hydrogeniformans]|uniref:sigma-70 family RNA polymerase sigma factor n=1 Tax=Sporanaerobium hydrogeniformans TaxID=3072179 RepID=UPI0015D4AACA|nr:sigma-70 family RNA polymerase sigma factor [Sporanaerobium hydrogeniformans]